MRKIRSLFLIVIPALFLLSNPVWSADNTATTTATNDMKATSQYVSDSSITAKVKSDLLLNQDIKSLSISVKTNKGIVTLSGNVTSEMQKQEAVNAAKQVTGVKAVKDKLMIIAKKSSQ